MSCALIGFLERSLYWLLGVGGEGGEVLALVHLRAKLYT